VSTIMLQMLPLSLIIHNGRLEWIGDIPGVRFTSSPDGFSLTLLTRKKPGAARYQYCYMVADPEPTAEANHYATIYSGKDPDKMVRWTRANGVSLSPRFNVDSGEYETVIIATVLSVPRVVHHKAARINASSSIPVGMPPTVLCARSHAKTDGTGGEGEV
jgi:hypothetical protein